MKPDPAQSAPSNDDGKGSKQAFYETLLATEHASPAAVSRFQQETLERYLRFAVTHSPFHARRLSNLSGPGGQLDLDKWSEVPVMTRLDLETHYNEIRPLAVPDRHGSISEVSTSGTGGRALIVRKSGLFNTALNCIFYRMGQAFGLDWSKPLVVIRSFDSAWGGPRKPLSTTEAWGPDWNASAGDGQRHRLSIHTPVPEQLAFLRTLGQAYVNTSAFNAMAIMEHVLRTGEQPPEILALLTVGEFVSDDLRQECRRHLNCPIIDAFSTAECGTLLTQCPDTDGYHVTLETTVVEVLKEDGTPCGPGETGRLTATPLYNFAMPLVRYQSDDLVTVGGSCECGRTAPMISRVHGRAVHQFIGPDDEVFRPEPAMEEVRRFAGFRRWQLVQTGEAAAEVRLMDQTAAPVIDTPGLVDYVTNLLPDGFDITVRVLPALGPSAGGKYASVKREWVPLRETA